MYDRGWFAMGLGEGRSVRIWQSCIEVVLSKLIVDRALHRGVVGFKCALLWGCLLCYCSFAVFLSVLLFFLLLGGAFQNCP